MSESRESNYVRIWAAAKTIPRGKVTTYGELATAAGLPRQPRLAGYAMYNLPAKSGVPWHRVINAQGRISFPPRSARAREQKRRLEAEGIVFMAGRVNLAQFGWQRAPSDSPLLD